MTTGPDTPIKPPRDPVPYEIAVSGSIWNGEQYFCTDLEAYRISGVPERSLRTLQKVGIVKATKLPRQHGGMTRAWHLVEVGAAAVVEAYKRATGQDYESAAMDLLPAAAAIKLLFGSFHGFSHVSELGDWRLYWRATLNFTTDAAFLTVSHIVYDQHHTDALESLRIELDRPGDPSRIPHSEGSRIRHHYLLAVRDDEGTMRAVQQNEIRNSTVSDVDAAHFETVINLHNVFSDVEIAAKKVRK